MSGRRDVLMPPKELEGLWDLRVSVWDGLDSEQTDVSGDEWGVV